VRDGLIADIDVRTSAAPGERLEGDYLLPGLVELHTDHLESHFMPRPGVRWDATAAVQAHDAQIALSGITTVFDALRVGSDDPVTAVMQYQAPVGAYQMGPNTPTFAVPGIGNNFVSSYPTTYADWSNDAGNIIYYSPRMSGFQLGLSYQPDGTRAPIDNIAILPNDNNGQQDVIAVAVNYENSFDGIDVAASVGYVHGSDEIGTAFTDDRETFQGGLIIGFSGFSVGGSIMQDNNGISSSFDTLTWDAGVTYSTGPWTVGFTYLSSTQEVGPLPDDELDAYAVTGTYNLGPGVDLWGGVKYLDYQEGSNDPAGNNEAIFGMVGTSISF